MHPSLRADFGNEETLISSTGLQCGLVGGSRVVVIQSNKGTKTVLC